MGTHRGLTSPFGHEVLSCIQTASTALKCKAGLTSPPVMGRGIGEPSGLIDCKEIGGHLP